MNIAKWRERTFAFLMKIPEKFHNSLTEQPFANCILCDKNLLDGAEYLIEKVYRRFPENGGEELIHEIAVCTDCAGNMRGELSEESKQKMEIFMWQKQMEQLQRGRPNPDTLLEKCFFTEKEITETDGYHVFAHCRGAELTSDFTYFTLSQDIIEEMQDLLSQKTKDELRRFTEENTGLPPELADLFQRGGPVLV